MVRNPYDDRSAWARHPFLLPMMLLLLGLGLAIGASYLGYKAYVAHKYATATLNEANMTDADIKQWATHIAQQSYAYNYKNYTTELPKLKPYFTPSGWDAFNEALMHSKNLDVVEAQKFKISTVVEPDEVEIETQGYDKELKRYAWKVEIPLIITYQGLENKLVQPTDIQMTIVRINPTEENPLGVAVNSFIATPANNDEISDNYAVSPQDKTEKAKKTAEKFDDD